MLQAKLSSNFRLAIPKILCHDLKLQAGQQFTLIARGKIIELIPIRSLQDAKGMLSSCVYNSPAEYRDRQERELP